MNGMAKHAVACAVLLCVCGAANAQSSVTIYGRADAGVDSPRSGGGSVNRLITGGQRGQQPGLSRR